jgi:Carboxypeptidase regulatory-like domain/TonB dependent receptor
MRRTLAVILFALVGTSWAHAQAVVGSGAITGIVMDRYGDGIPETIITLSNKELGFKRVMQTTDDGIFTLPALIPANNYDMKVTRRGYADWELPSFNLSTGETLNFKVRLYADKAASPTEALRAVAPVQDSKTSVTALVTDDQLFALPTKDLGLQQFALLAPAVVESPDGVLVVRGETFRNVFYLDGINILNNYFPVTPGLAPFIPQEAVAQMQVIPAAAPADFGHTMGGFLNAVSKTGNNGLHASVYDYYSENSWQQPDFFGDGFKPTGRQNHGGVSVGLPLWADSLFLFGNLERVNDSSQELNRILNPLLTAPGGNTALITGCTATAAQCANAAYFIQRQLNVKVPESQITTNGFARMDFRPTDHDSMTLASAILSGRGVNTLDNATVSTNGGAIGANANVTNSTRYATYGWTHVIGQKMVNEGHLYWFRDTTTAATNASQYPAGTSTCLACGTGPVGITVDGTSLGGNPQIPFNMREQRYGGSDTFTMTLGSHTLRIGGDVWRRQDTMDQLYARYGNYTFDSLSTFADDFSFNVRALKNYANFDQTLGTSSASSTDWLIGAFAEDTWKVKPGLTITAGVRYEKSLLPLPLAGAGNNFYLGVLPSPNTDFAPTLGIAYMLDNRTVVRIGGGAYFEPFPGQLIHDLYVGGGSYQTGFSLTPGDTGATVFPAVLPAGAPNTLNAALIDEIFAAQKFRNPYSIQGTAGIERRLNRWVSLALTYIRSDGVKIWTATDLNMIGSNSTSETYTINNAQGQAVNTYTTQVSNGSSAGHHFEVDNGGSSRYQAGNAQLRTASLFGFSFQATYTWSHAFDDLSGPRVPNTTVNSNSFPSSYKGDWGPSQFDQRNHAVANFTWQPKVNRSDALSRFLLNGWLVSGIATYSSSMYATPLVEVDGQQFAVTTSVNTKITMDYPSSPNGTGGWSRVPFQAVNILPIGSQLSIDPRVSKTVPFTERLHGQFTVEAFNVTNHRNVSAVNTIAYTATGGVLTPVAGLGLPISSYGYPFGTTARHMEVSFRLTW